MKKQYTVTLKGKVKQVSFRQFTEDLFKRLFVGGVIYDVGYDEAKVLVEAEEATVNKFCQLLKEGNQVTETKVEEGIQLPYPLAFAVTV